MNIVQFARLFLYVRELAENTGQRVGGFQHWCGGISALGKRWCAFFLTFLFDVRDQGKSALPRTGDCDVILSTARANGWIVEEPEPGDGYLCVRGTNDAHHVGLVTRGFYQHSQFGKAFDGLSGNTSKAGTSDNGDRVAEKPQRYVKDKHVFFRVPRPA